MAHYFVITLWLLKPSRDVVLTESAEIQVFVSSNPANPSLPSSMLMMPEIEHQCVEIVSICGIFLIKGNVQASYLVTPR